MVDKSIRRDGISRELFPYYLKELEFRYNSRNSNLFEKILEVLKSG